MPTDKAPRGEKKVVRVDKSPMNPKVTIFQLECGHDYYKSNHRGPYPKKVVCDKCEEKAMKPESPAQPRRPTKREMEWDKHMPDIKKPAQHEASQPFRPGNGRQILSAEHAAKVIRYEISQIKEGGLLENGIEQGLETVALYLEALSTSSQTPPTPLVHADTLLGIFCQGKAEEIAKQFPDGVPWKGFERIADWINNQPVYKAAQTPPSETAQELHDRIAIYTINEFPVVGDPEMRLEISLDMRDELIKAREELAALRSSGADAEIAKLREDIKALEFNCEAYEEELDRLKELVGYHGGEDSLVDHIRDMKKPLEQNLNRVGKGDNLEYLITQACNKIFNGDIPLGFCSAHLSKEGKPHAETAECKGWRSSGMPDDENYIGWARYKTRYTKSDGERVFDLQFCDSDIPGAFKVYRRSSGMGTPPESVEELIQEHVNNEAISPDLLRRFAQDVIALTSGMAKEPTK